MNAEKQKAIERVEDLRKALELSRESIDQAAQNLGSFVQVTGKTYRLCLSQFDNLDRIARDVINAIEKV